MPYKNKILISGIFIILTIIVVFMLFRKKKTGIKFSENNEITPLSDNEILEISSLKEVNEYINVRFDN